MLETNRDGGDDYVNSVDGHGDCGNNDDEDESSGDGNGCGKDHGEGEGGGDTT